MRAFTVLALWIGIPTAVGNSDFRCIFKDTFFTTGPIGEHNSAAHNYQEQANKCGEYGETAGCCYDFRDEGQNGDPPPYYTCYGGHGCIADRASCAPDKKNGYAYCDCDKKGHHYC